MLKPIFFLFYTSILQISSQTCPEEVSEKGIIVTWPESTNGSNVVSDPLCYYEDHLVTRHCNDSKWSPSLHELESCLKVVQHFNLSSCPPGFHKISDSNNDYCFQTSDSSSWNYPCLKSGGASDITELTDIEIQSLWNTLKKLNVSRYFWLPAQRTKLLNPVVWTIPGPKWGITVTRGHLNLRFSLLKNCMLLDIEQQQLITESCEREYPSLCFYINDLQYPVKCPQGYHGFRFLPDNGTCLGIEEVKNTTLTYDEFVNTKCPNPMGHSRLSDVSRFLFKKIAEMNNLPNDTWCWFATSYVYNVVIDNSESFENNTNLIAMEVNNPVLQGIVNNNGTLGLTSRKSKLSCMACKAEMKYEDTRLILEYNESEKKIYLTIYFPSGLLKYDTNDRGIQCFSDARGFVKVIDVNDEPFIRTFNESCHAEFNSSDVEKVVYVIDLVTERSAQYWCEGHTNHFSLINTNKIVVNPNGNRFHVFALVITVPKIAAEVEEPGLLNFSDTIALVFDAEKVLIMEFFEYNTEKMLMLLHVHVAVSEIHENQAATLQYMYDTLQLKAETELTRYNFTFVNISSSLYCLPTTSDDYMELDWELTPIGHTTAPKQFCLQSNGLPVRRQCYGSYLLGGRWGKVEGQCDIAIQPSLTTEFLYNFVKGRISEDITSRFLIDGLNFVLDDVGVIIPADIYYLAMSLRYVVNVAQVNQTSMEMGDIANIVWAMDRILMLNNSNLRLAQTFNSTNIILDTVNGIIEILAEKLLYENQSPNTKQKYYHLALKPQFVVHVSYPEFNNITGLAIIRRTESNNFTDMTIQPLFKNTTLESVLLIDNLELATWIPVPVLNSLRQHSNSSFNETMNVKDVHIVITVFHNDAVFQQLDRSSYAVNSRVVGISIPGYISNLELPVPLIFKEINGTTSRKVCGYWDFQRKRFGGNPGFWTNQDCFYLKSLNSLTVCECFHMTHFGQLIDIGSNLDTNEKTISDLKHSKALNSITLVGSFMSLLGIAGIWITALVFQTWRKKPGTKVLLQLSTAIALPLLFIVVFNLDSTIFIEIEGQMTISDSMKVVCIIMGAFLHYSILASFMWMLITAILQFIRYVRVLGVCRPSRFMIKFTLIGWGVPLIPVISILVSDTENYIPDLSIRTHDKHLCYPTGRYFILGVLLPVAVILLVNIVLFILVIYAISRGPDGKMRATDTDLVGAQLRVSVFLFFLLGLTWVFGIFSFSDNLIWSYLFCLTSTLQGFVLFIYFVICDPATRSLWVTLMKPQFRLTSRDSISSVSTST